MRYFLGVDGGQSSTTALIGDKEGRIVGRGAGWPGNEEQALRRAIQKACAAAELDPETLQFAGACLGFSGGAARRREMAARVVRCGHLSVLDDYEIALLGATGGEAGIITIAGTGSISFGRNAAGVTARAGGWGHLFGDEGSAFDIAKQAIRASMRSAEGWGSGQRLLEELLAATGTIDAKQMLHRFYEPGFERSEIARLAITVDRLANEGDPVAREILTAGAQQLAGYTAAVRGRLFGAGEPALVSPVGGVFNSAIVRERFQMLVELDDGNRVVAPICSPAEGAVGEARRIAGIE